MGPPGSALRGVGLQFSCRAASLQGAGWGWVCPPASISCFLGGKVSKGVLSLGRRQGPFKPTALSATLVSASGSSRQRLRCVRAPSDRSRFSPSCRPRALAQPVTASGPRQVQGPQRALHHPCTTGARRAGKGAVLASQARGRVSAATPLDLGLSPGPVQLQLSLLRPCPGLPPRIRV